MNLLKREKETLKQEIILLKTKLDISEKKKNYHLLPKTL